MPNTKSAKEDVRVSARRQVRNKAVKSQVKSRIDTAEGLITSVKLDEAKGAVGTAVSSLDKAAGRGKLHPNNAARRKSRLMKKLNKAQAAPPAGTKPA